MATNGRTRRTQRARGDWRPAFLAAYADTGMVMEACKVAGVARSTVYDERQRNEDFALAWDDVERVTTEKLEQEAVRRALDESDRLLEFLLKGRRPDIYADRQRVEHSGRIRSGPEVDPEEVERLREIEERYFGEVE